MQTSTEKSCFTNHGNLNSRSPLPSSAPTWVSSRSLAPSQVRDRESALALVPRNEDVGGGEGGGEAEECGEDDKVW